MMEIKNKEELDKAIIKLRTAFLVDMSKLYDNYAAHGRKANVGDIVTNGRCTIKVNSVYYSATFDCICYKGISLTKKLAEFKSGEEYTIFHDCIGFKVVKKAGE